MPKIQFHPTRDRLEIEFDGVPSRDIRRAINEVGFIFDGRAMVWHLREKNVVYAPGKIAPAFVDGWQKALDVLRRLFGVTADECEKFSSRRDCAHTRAGERGMEEACGII